MRISDWSSDVCSSDLAVHEEALAALLDDADWASRAADAQVDRLHGVLDGTAPAAQPAGENDVAASTLAVFREARELRRTHGAGAIGLYIISMARTAADALAVLALARIAGCVEDRQSVGEGKSVSGRVGPGGGRYIQK